MEQFPSDFEHRAVALHEIYERLRTAGVEVAILKMLPKNANDKNQIYLASDFGVLFDLFDITVGERAISSSEKSTGAPTSRITEAVFASFHWMRRDGRLVRAKRAKAIIYPQYPEARLSGLQTVENTMPQSMAVTYTKSNPDSRRLLVLGKLPRGECLSLVYIEVSSALEDEVNALPGFERARACKRLLVEQKNSEKLASRLTKVLGRTFRGSRLDAYGRSLPFSGTQVCGYTLEHELGIIPNADMNGDLYGIELKTHTQVKVTLFTPEPDGGHYCKDFNGFMHKYGYLDNNGDLRLTGIHRAGVMCDKSGLTLQVREFRLADGVLTAFPYDSSTPLTTKIDTVDVALIDKDGEVAAAWSLARLMNCWGAKHNEVVFIPAIKEPNQNTSEVALGYEYKVSFSENVMWCTGTSAEQLLDAINSGTIFLDPAPKLHATNSSKNKRRAQWRVNDVTKAAATLYSKVEFKNLITELPVHEQVFPIAAQATENYQVEMFGDLH
jgi:hypothetical protein